MNDTSSPGPVVILGLLSTGLAGTVIQLIALTRQVFVIEAAIRKDRSPLAPFNLQLLTMSASLLAVHICYIVQIIYGHNTSLPWILTLLLDFFSATFEFAYVRYSWTRASTIIAQRINSLSLRIITFFVKICPFILYAQTLPALFDAIASHYPPLAPYLATVSPIEQGLSALAGVCLLCFDVTLLIGFASKTRAMKKEMNEVGITGSASARTEVIVRHGVVSCCVWICVVMVYAASTFLEQFSFQYNLITVFIYWGSLGTVAVLYHMKVALFKLDGKESMVHVSLGTGNAGGKDSSTQASNV
ncbi:hypothetical protein BC830DRAFT_1102160 [Chytriomyces sp. MP71]|nr:hypothetical protein BC830DRAFT_1102160 [Chytriomyces sp. MP71]